MYQVNYIIINYYSFTSFFTFVVTGNKKGSRFLSFQLPDTLKRDGDNMDPNTTILRVKRKRGTDPADALLLACKRIRPETSQSSGETVPEPNEAEVENSVFKLVATVATQVRGPMLSSEQRSVEGVAFEK